MVRLIGERWKAGARLRAMICIFATFLGGWGHGSPVAAQRATQETVVIQRIVIDPSSIFSDDELSAVTSKYVGIPMDPAHVDEMINDIDALYIEKGFVGKAIAPDPVGRDGVLTIRLVEARVGKIVVTGNPSTREDYITARLDVHPDGLLNVHSLDETITLFNHTNDAKIHAELAPGETFGSTDVTVLVDEPQVTQWHGAVENSGRSEYGDQRHSLTWSHRSLTGRRDALSLNVLSAAGTSGISAAYSGPVMRHLKYGLSFSANDVEFLEGAFAAVQVKRASRQWSVSLTHPVHATPTSASFVTLEGQLKQADTYIEDVSLASAVNRNVTLSHGGESQEENRSWSLSHSIRVGRATAANYTSSRFHKYNAAGQHTWHWPGGIRLTWRGEIQYTFGGTLPGDEQFALGGWTSVRGIKESVITRDRGYFTSLEYRGLLSTDGSEAFAFLDHGGAGRFGQLGLPPNERFMTSVGFGLDVRLFDATLLQLLFAFPQGDLDEVGEERLYARLNFLF